MDGVCFIGMYVQIDDHDDRILPMIMHQTEKTSQGMIYHATGKFKSYIWFERREFSVWTFGIHEG